MRVHVSRSLDIVVWVVILQILRISRSGADNHICQLDAVWISIRNHYDAVCVDLVASAVVWTEVLSMTNRLYLCQEQMYQGLYSVRRRNGVISL